ncbi:unnamed protein product [Symbiodinium necroappetens]|uniref:Uncharacterized protein n=1 Tax=Symbiodinium necroappetens TaxID=1628268 RepID=A0A812S1X6_9DINO|nr:unnamed protein product [Symbiodinium necroappetens]
MEAVRGTRWEAIEGNISEQKVDKREPIAWLVDEHNPIVHRPGFEASKSGPSRKHHTMEPKNDAGGIFDDFNPHMHPDLWGTKFQLRLCHALTTNRVFITLLCDMAPSGPSRLKPSRLTLTRQDTIKYLEKMGRERNPHFNVSWIHFGLSGGSYYKAEAILDAFDPKWVRRLDFEGMEKREGDKTMSSDFAMLVALYARGWDVYPWDEVSQHWLAPRKPGDPERKSEKMSAAFEHNHKEHYNDHVPDEERKLITTFVQRQQDTTCHGCVWYHDADPHQVRPIPGKQPPMPVKWRYPLKHSADHQQQEDSAAGAREKTKAEDMDGMLAFRRIAEFIGFMPGNSAVRSIIKSLSPYACLLSRARASASGWKRLGIIFPLNTGGHSVHGPRQAI